MQFAWPDRPAGGVYVPPTADIMFISDHGNKLRISAMAGDKSINSIDIKGSRINKDYASLQNALQEINLNVAEEEMKYEYGLMYGDKEIQETGAQKRAERLMRTRTLYADYIRNNPANPLSLLCLWNLPSDSVETLGNMLYDIAQVSFLKPLYNDKVESYRIYSISKRAKKEVIEGGTAPDFTLEDGNGNSVSPYTTGKNFVLLDFWGSWCPPCMQGMQRMKQLYEALSEQMEIIGIACNERSQEDWLGAIEKNGLSWRHILDTEGSSALKVLYGIEGYPTKILLDGNGKILLRSMGEDDGFYTRVEKIVKEG